MTKSQDKEKENLIYTNGLGQMTKETLSKIFDTPENRNKEFQRGIKSERERILKIIDRFGDNSFTQHGHKIKDFGIFEELKQEISDSQNASQKCGGCIHSPGHSDTHSSQDYSGACKQSPKILTPANSRKGSISKKKFDKYKSRARIDRLLGGSEGKK